MEITKQQKNFRYRFMIDAFIAGGLFIAAGLLIILRNLGYLEPSIFKAVISWPSLILIFGIWSLFHRHFKSGVFLIVMGGFFLIPYITGAGAGWIHTYWPFIFVLVGVQMIVFHLLPKRWRHHSHHFPINTRYHINDGYVTSENNFGTLRQIVLDDVFKGARIENNFGGTVLDLRGTTIEPGDTIIDLESSFGGVEIFVPSNWAVITEIQSSLGGVDDKRKCIAGIQPELKLRIRGKISFSGVEIKN